MTKLSVNINKFATLRNARGGNNPNLLAVAEDCERFGAQGITVHPRPDERHITHADVIALKDVVSTEFNIEGYPDERLLKLIILTRPTQATLVPDSPEVLTSNAGWDTIKHQTFLSDIIRQLKELGIRTSLFIDPDKRMIEGAAQTGADRIELYTEEYADNFEKDAEGAIKKYRAAALVAQSCGLEVNAGHDLDLNNLSFFNQQIPGLKEVSIGHALVCDALYLGLENTIQLYLRKLNG